MSNVDWPTVPFAELPDTCLLSCVKLRLGDSTIRRTEVTRQKTGLPIYVKLRFFDNLPCMSKGNRHSH